MKALSMKVKFNKQALAVIAGLVVILGLGSVYAVKSDLFRIPSNPLAKSDNLESNAPADIPFDIPTEVTQEEKNLDEEAKKDFSAALNPKTDPKLPKGFQLVIPKIGVDWHVLEGTTNPDAILLKGFWKYPNTAYPSERSNTVILGHRWVYKKGDPKTLYSLDKLSKGDEIMVYYQQKKYVYKMTRSYVTGKDDLDMMDGTLTPTLTIVTSHPIEESKIISQQRLVVIGELASN